VFKTDEKDYGVRSLDDIAKNTFVCEYAGEVISLDVARSRTKNLRKNEPNYLLTLLEHIGENPTRTHVDPTYIGNVGRFINHSCQPNLYMVPVRVDHDIPHLALFAIRDVTAGEELTFDYSGNLQMLDNQPNDVKAILEDKDDESGAGTPCNCGSAHCRGFLPFDEVLFTE
jgi:histone-lysine N-methyltransferase SETMAR